MILRKRLRQCDSFLLLVQRGFGVELVANPTSLLLGGTSSTGRSFQPAAGGSASTTQADADGCDYIEHHRLSVIVGYRTPPPNLHSQDYTHKPTATMGVPFEALLPYGIMVSCAYGKPCDQRLNADHYPSQLAVRTPAILLMSDTTAGPI